MLKVENLSKIYKPKKGKPVTALDSISLDIEDKGIVFLLGKSGSGKSTLLNLLGGLDSYTSGDIIIKGKSTKNIKQSGFDSYRNTYIGFIFQEFNILEDYSVGQNIGMALELQHKKADKIAINDILKQVDLEDYFNRNPNELSGGQKQRVAIARALVKEPEIIMADEPTGALDSNTGRQVFETLKKISEQKLVIVVTHDRENAEIYGDRIIELADGKIISDRIRSQQTGLLVEQNVTILDNKLIKIKAGKKLESSDIVKINNILSKSNEDAYISLDSSANKDFSQKASKILGGDDTSFKPTTKENLSLKDYNQNDLKFVKSRLPAKDSFKMGVSGLKHKKIRLVFTILFSFLTFLMAGVSTSAALFERNNSEIQTLEQLNSKNVYIRRLQGEDGGFGIAYSEYGASGFSSEQLDELEKLTGQKPIKVMKTGSSSFENSLAFYGRKKLYYQIEYKGFAVIENEENSGLEKIGDSRLPFFADEIAISDYTAASFVEYNYRDPDGKIIEINEPQEMINKVIYVSNRQYTITGVYKTGIDLSSFDKYKDDKMSQFDTLSFDSAYLFMGLCYVSPAFNTNTYVTDYYNLRHGSYTLYNKDNTLSINDKYLSLLRQSNKDNVSIQYFLSSSYSLNNYSENILLSLDNAKKLIPSFEQKIIDSGLDENYEFDKLKALWDDIPATDKKIKFEYRSSYSNAIHSYEKEVEVVGITNAYLNALYVTGELFNKVIAADKNNAYKNMVSFTTNVYGFSPDGHNEITSFWANDYMLLPSQSSRIYWGKGISPRELADDEIILSSFTFSHDHDKAKEIFDSLQNKTVVWGKNIWGNDDTLKTIGDKKFKVVGLYLRSPETIVNKQFFEYLDEFNSRPTDIIIRLTNDDKQNKKIYNYIKASTIKQENLYEKLFIASHITNLLDLLESITGTIKKILSYLAIAFSIFSSFLFMNFISTSIMNKKKEIGVLRAIGARSNDVFKIFFAEGLVIGLINFALAAIALSILTMAVNMYLGVAVFVFNILPYLLMAGLSLLVVVVATFIPVRKVAAKKPIDAINNR